MPITISSVERVARARADLRIGAPVVVTGGDGAVLVAATETVSDERLSAMRAMGALTLAITFRRAETLRARAYDGDLARIAVPDDADLGWVRATADPSLDLAQPMKGPYRTLREGGAELHRAALMLCKDARLLPAALVTTQTSADVGLTEVSAAEVTQAHAAAISMTRVSGARVPTRFSDRGRVQVFRPDDGGEEHYAIEIGTPDRSAPVLSRLHSACFTGDVLGSLKCDCGPQLHAALDQIAAEGAGVLLYLNQEGRGIGLANKMRAYALQDQGYDTVDANHRLGFEDDERDFRIGAEILRRMGFSSVRLMTNNPGKLATMTASGIAVAERVPLIVGKTQENTGYLATKAARSGHML